MTANTNQKSIDVLNNLIEVNSNRFDGYEYASNETKGSTMKFLFMQLSESSFLCMNELIFEVKRSGGIPKRSVLKNENVLSIWIDVKTAIADNNTKTLFKSCEVEEATVVNEYESILNTTNDKDPDHQDLIAKQFLRLKRDASKMKNLRKAFIQD